MGNKPNWEQILKSSFSIATLRTDTKNPMLSVNKILKVAGFDVTKRYEILFDHEQLLIGLRMSDSKNSFAVSMKRNIAASLLCKKFDLKGRYHAVDFEQDGNTWILKMEKA